MSPTDGLLRFTSKQLDRMESALARAMSTRDVESVHELRVSSRRLNEPLELIGSLFARRQCRAHRDALSEIRGALRTVRDFDVLRMALASTDDYAIHDPSAHAKLLAVLAIQRENELSAARRVIQSLRAKRVRSEIAALCDRVARLDAKRDHKQILRAARRLWNRKAKALLDRPPAREHGPGLHKTRIRLKAFRYSTELMVRLDGQDRDELLKACAAMQDRLGNWNDHFTATRLLATIAQDEFTLAAGPTWSASVLEHAASRARQMNDELDDISREWPDLRSAIESMVLGRVESELASASRSLADDSRHALERV